ncbi:BA14K family protein [Bartonella sp. CB175]|uniref:BA14K family protein n=1 Tax=Bartonella sp. CB175 TaxID=3112256 RepID=UPI00300E64FF
MRKFIKPAVLSAASAATVLVPLSTAFANKTSFLNERITQTTITDPFFNNSGQIRTQTYINRHQVRREEQTSHFTRIERHKHVHNHFVEQNNSGDTLAAGILGLAAGALLGNALKKSEPPQPQIVYQVAPQRQVIYEVPQTQVVYQAPPIVTYQNQQLSASWLQYCRTKYRSFNPETGTFRGYDGKDHFCYAPVAVNN